MYNKCNKVKYNFQLFIPKICHKFVTIDCINVRMGLFDLELNIT